MKPLTGGCSSPAISSTGQRGAPFTKGDRHRVETHNAIRRNNLTRSQSPFVNSRMNVFRRRPESIFVLGMTDFL